MNYYPFNVGDYAAHTAHLEPMEDLAYRRLLDLYYLSEKPLPADVQVTARLIRMRSAAVDVEAVLNEFFTLMDDGWRHARCDAEIVRMQDKQAKARASAHASVNARRANAERSLPKEQANVERTLPKKPADVELPTPTPTPIEIPSEAKASGAGSAEVSTADVIFAIGVPLLTASGVTDRNARSMLGLMRKTHGDELVIGAIDRMAHEKPLQPVAWLQAALGAKTKQAGKHSGFALKNYREGIAEDGTITS